MNLGVTLYGRNPIRPGPRGPMEDGQFTFPGCSGTKLTIVEQVQLCVWFSHDAPVQDVNNAKVCDHYEMHIGM